MSVNNIKTLTREVTATVVPAGDDVQLPAGMRVTITHRLGGNFTVTCDYGMFRIQGKDADALDEEVPQEALAPGASKDDNHEGPPEDSAIWEQLKSVYDPEIPVNIVDLGLVYSMEVKPLEAEEGKFMVLVHMTLTAPGCGMGPSIAADAESRLIMLPGVDAAHVEIVWDPPWTQDMISEEGKMELGLI